MLSLRYLNPHRFESLYDAFPTFAALLDNGYSFPLEPQTIFYDWLYINAIYPHRKWLERLYVYAGFTDIEFNPNKSINCQARSCALFVSLMKNDLLHQAVASPQAFTELISHYEYHRRLRNGDPQSVFF